MSDSRSAFDAWIEAFNSHDQARIRALTGERCVFEGPGGVHVEGADAATGYATTWLNAFSDAKLTAETVVVARSDGMYELRRRGEEDRVVHTLAEV